MKNTHKKQIKIHNIIRTIFIGGRNKMEKNQKINCTVTSCRYNDGSRQECNLEQIIVTPVNNVSSKNPDESMCSSYKSEQ